MILEKFLIDLDYSRETLEVSNMLELKKRIITSFFLFSLIILMYFYNFILIIGLIIITVIVWIEFNGLISKIFSRNDTKNKILRFIYKSLSLIYQSSLSIFIILIFVNNTEYKIFVIYALSISIASDTGGLLFGKIFKGRKLTKISPKKTISGSVGSFILSLLLIPFFSKIFENFVFIEIVIYTLLISLMSQIGDLFISYLKRKAKVKNTSDLLPGHGGLLDRIDGIIFALPLGIFLTKFL